MTNKKLIKLICSVFFLAGMVGIILFVINVVTDYRTYTDSEIVKANVINVSGTKTACWMLNINTTMAARSMRKTLGNPSARLERETKKKFGYGKAFQKK